MILTVALGLLATAVCTPASGGVSCPGSYWTSNGKYITAVSSFVEGTFASSASSPAACCNACQNEPGCAYSQWDSAGCHIALAAGGSCSASTVVGQFYTGSMTSLGVLTLSNGPCGHLTYGGNNPTKRDEGLNRTPTKRDAAVNGNCSNAISQVNGKVVDLVESDTEGSLPTAATNNSDCCVACYNEPGCAYFQFDKNGCSLALVGGTCSAVTIVGKYYTSTTGGDAIEIGNGPCGTLVYGGDNPS
ncbi:hypothetical protein N7G274_001876 [Stereocaulon virgatum]|uniref:Apple domain-containing protein n=1 Tax=Stereocaulon virgatum TaxID=373712 RepID=A0ABR4AP21_9LECA